MMKFTKEMIEKAKSAATAEELLAAAKEENIEMTEKEAAEAFAELHKTGELSDEELDNVAGGGCDDKSNNKSGDTPKFKAGDKVYYNKTTPSTRGFPIQKRIDAVVIKVHDKSDGVYFYSVTGGVIKTENELYSR